MSAPLNPVGRTASGKSFFRRRRGFFALAPLILLLLLWMWLFYAEDAYRGGPSGKAFGADFAMFVAGARAMQEGHNAYDHTVLYRTETQMMADQHLPMTKKRQVVRVGNPPLFLWALRPVTGLPFQPVAWTWIIGLYALSLVGFQALLSYLGWPRRLVPSIVFMLMPPVVLSAFYGNVLCVVFAALAAALLLLDRRPVLAGCLMSLAWLKPPVGLPVVLLLLLFQARDWRRATGGFAIATAVGTVLTVLVAGPHSLLDWERGLTAYSRDMGIQPDVASLAGLYVLWASHALRLVLATVLLVAILAVTAIAWRKLPAERPLPLRLTAYLWFAWILASPYAHIFDLMLLSAPALAIMGPQGSQWNRPRAVITAYLLFASLLFINPTPFHIYLLPLPILIAAWLVYGARDQAVRNQQPQQASLSSRAG